MPENETTYEKKLVVEIKVTSKELIRWLDPEIVRKAMFMLTTTYEKLGIEVTEHKCQVKAGSVDAAFERIDQLEERMCECLGHFVDALRSAKHGR